jgi:N-hydroxyarylamine O-acetyltransferase
MDASGFDLPAYLERIGYEGEVAPTLDTLRGIQLAHLTSIPFENLDVQLGVPVRLDLEHLQAKLVTRRRGGYCFEQNTLFMAALRTIGFKVTPLTARVRLGATEITPRTHMLLAVDLDGGRTVADVGFGGDCPPGPLRLEEAGPTDLYGWWYRIVREGAATWVLQAQYRGTWSDLYAFTEEPAPTVDLVMANHYTSTFPASSFVTTLTVQRIGVRERVILRNRLLAVERPDGSADRTTLGEDPDELLELLRQRFGLILPRGTRFRAMFPDRTPVGFHHVQLAMPSGREPDADAFYADLLGLSIVPKPAALEACGGRWYRGVDVELHLGVDADFTPAGKAHPALLVRGLQALRARLEAAGASVIDDVALEGFERLHVHDPFANRLELIERSDAAR